MTFLGPFSPARLGGLVEALWRKYFRWNLFVGWGGTGQIESVCDFHFPIRWVSGGFSWSRKVLVCTPRWVGEERDRII